MVHKDNLTKFQRKFVDNCKLYKDRIVSLEEIIPNKKYWYDGCLQQKFYVDNKKYYTNFTVQSYYIYVLHCLPPKELLYDGWETQKIYLYNRVKLNMSQFWVVCTKTAVPKCLQVDGWNTQKFIYDALYCSEHDECDDTTCEWVFLYGDINDAYKYYGVSDGLINKNLCEDYKISDDEVCGVCFEEHQEIYNFCDEEHNDGICLKCYNQLQTNNCPFCGDRMHNINKFTLTVESIK